MDCVERLRSDGDLTIFDYVNEHNAAASAMIETGKPCYFQLAADPTRHLSKCHQTHSGGTYYGWNSGDACRHGIELVTLRLPSLRHFKSGTEVYLKTYEDGMKGYVYLTAPSTKNLWYENNRGEDEKWVIERTDPSLHGFIQKGEKVRFKSVRQSKDQNQAVYLSAESDGYLATRSAADTDSRILGIEWTLTD